MFKRILVPLDGSTLAEQAIPHAVEFARIFNSHIILLQVLEALSTENEHPVDPLSWQLRKTRAEVYLKGIKESILEKLGDAPGGKKNESQQVEFAIREGKTAENIVDYAHNENIELIVITTHGSGGLSRWTTSSVIQKVINLIYLPVLVVRAYNLPGEGEARIPYRRILLPIDSSRRSECTLPAGIALARRETSVSADGKETEALPETPGVASSGAKIYLAAVIKPPEIPIPEPYPVEIGQLIDQLMNVSREALTNYLNEMSERLPVDSQICIADSASVSSAIHKLAEEEDIDLVVLCAHGYTGNHAWPYGNVTRNYIDHGTKPLLVIQDVHRSQIRPSAAELAADKTGRR